MDYKKFLNWFSVCINKNIGFSVNYSKKLANVFFDIFVLVGDAMNEYEDIISSEDKIFKEKSND